MDKNSIIQAIIGLIIAGLGSCIGWLFNSISELKHNQDITIIKVEQNKEEISGSWAYIDEDLRLKVQEVKEQAAKDIQNERDKAAIWQAIANNNQ